MIKAKSFIRFTVLAVVMTVVSALQSCSNKEASALLEKVGNDAQCVGIIHPKDILKSLDVKSNGDDLQFPAWMGARSSNSGVVSDLLSVKGYDTDLVLVAVYGGNNFCLLNITDEGDFTKSLKNIGFKKESGTTNPTYTRGESAVVIKDDTAWVAYNFQGKNVLTKIGEAIKAADTPLDSWKVDLLKSNEESAVSILAIEEKSDLAVTISIDLDGPELTAKALAYDSKGNKRELASADDVATLDEHALKLGANDNIIVAIGAPLSFKWTDLLLSLIPYDGDFVSADDLNSFTGAMYFSANCDNLTAESGVLNYKNWQIYMALGASGNAQNLLDKYSENFVSSGFNVSKTGNVTKISMPPLFSINAKPEGDYVVLYTDNAASGKRLTADDIKDCVSLVSLNLPADFVFFKSCGIDAGLQCKLCMKRNEATLTLKFTDTQNSFLNAAGSALNAMQFYW